MAPADTKDNNTCRETIIQTLKAFHGDGSVFEIRCLGVDGRKGRTDSGYFDDIEQAADAVIAHARRWQSKGIYFTINPVYSSCLSRAKNRIKEYAETTTSDQDILLRRMLYLDFDPIRPADISSTEAEMQAAIQRANVVCDWMLERGWPQPIVAASGNGAHLLFPIDVSHDSETTALIKTATDAIAQKFSDAVVSVDLTVFNPARICRLYGTPARKGDSTDDRPHRLAMLLYVPDYLRDGWRQSDAASQQLLDDLAAMKAPEKPPERQQSTGTDIERKLILPQYLRRLGIDYKESKGQHGDILQIDCPFDPNHKKPDAYVGQMPGGALVFHCSHDSCSNQKWTQFAEKVGKPEPDEWDPPRKQWEYNSTAGVDDSRANPEANGANVDKSKKIKLKDEPYRPFPKQLLPTVLEQFVTETSQSIGCDAAFCALPVLCVCAAAIGTSRSLMIKGGWFVPSVLWAVCIGESGSQKSPPLREAIRPFKDREARQAEVYAAEMARYAEEKAEYKRQLKAWDKKPDGDRPEEPQRPPRPRCLISDTTIEALAPVLKENERGVLMPRDELSGWLSSFDKYSQRGGTSSDAAKWLEIYGCESIQIDRKTGDEKCIFVGRPSVCICGGIQPGILEKCMSDENKLNGLQARLLMAYPPRQPKRWRDEEPSIKVVDAYHAAVAELFTLQPDTDSSGQSKPSLLRLSDEAKAVFREFVNLHGDEQSALQRDLASQWSKLEEIPARIAIVLHCVQQVTEDVDDAFVVSGQTMLNAVGLTEWLKTECLRISRLMVEPEETRQVRHLKEWIQSRGGAITARDLCRYRRDIQSTDQADMLLMQLASFGVGEWHDIHKSREFRLYSDGMSTIRS